MAAVKYYVRTTTKKVNPKVNIRVRFSYSSNVAYGTLPTIINLDSWNHKAQKIKTAIGKESGHATNRELLSIDEHLIACFNKIHDKDAINGQWLQEQIDLYYEPKKKAEIIEVRFFDYVTQYMKKIEKQTDKRSGRKLAPNTLKKYTTTYNRIKEFKETYDNALLLKDVDIILYNDFIEFLTFECNYAVNSINKHIAILKVVLNDAKSKGYQIDLTGFIKPSEESQNIYLNQDELTQLYKHDLSEFKYLEKVRDLFIVGCWTGLRFSDLTSLTKKDVSRKIIRVKTEKTGAMVSIPFHTHTKQILQKYNYNLPTKISNQKFNKYIKEACAKAEISEEINRSITKGGKEITTLFTKNNLVSSHTARRSFASNLYKAGVPHYSIMAITGHKTEDSFLKYIKVSNDEHAEKVQELFDKMALELG